MTNTSKGVLLNFLSVVDTYGCIIFLMFVCERVCAFASVRARDSVRACLRVPYVRNLMCACVVSSKYARA